MVCEIKWNQPFQSDVIPEKLLTGWSGGGQAACPARLRTPHLSLSLVWIPPMWPPPPPSQMHNRKVQFVVSDLVGRLYKEVTSLVSSNMEGIVIPQEAGPWGQGWWAGNLGRLLTSACGWRWDHQHSFKFWAFFKAAGFFFSPKENLHGTPNQT